MLSKKNNYRYLINLIFIITDGSNIMENGPSDLIIGINNSSSIANIRAGKRKTIVFPYPDGAIPIRSLFNKLVK